MNLRGRLLQRLTMEDINEILFSAQKDEKIRSELYQSVFDSEVKVSINALWIMTHYSDATNKWLYSKQNELIDKVLISENTSQKRLLLSLLYKQPLAEPLRVDFLDFCLGLMISQREPYGVTSLCLKLAYEMCKTIPELLQEYRMALDIMEPSLLPPSMRTARRNILKKMNS